MKKVSLIVTTLNEEKTIVSLLKSVGQQVLVPDEVIIVDGGSSDRTVMLMRKFETKLSHFLKIPIKIFIKKGNRSVGRNYAIDKANNSWIAITDAGCLLDSKWLQKLLEKQSQSKSEVVAGYYTAVSHNPLQKAMIPYVLVMPDRVDEANFLPATRSVFLNKKVWEKLGGFDERLSDNEDYDFARRLRKNKIGISFAKRAVVNWIPHSTLKSFNNMIFRFARGDIYAGIIRPKVLLIFLRYLLGLSVFIWGVNQWVVEGNIWIMFGLIPALLMIYVLWSIIKNYRYVKESFYWLPILQITSDAAVMWGSVCGLFKRISAPKNRR